MSRFGYEEGTAGTEGHPAGVVEPAHDGRGPTGGRGVTRGESGRPQGESEGTDEDGRSVFHLRPRTRCSGRVEGARIEGDGPWQAPDSSLTFV